MVLPLPPTPPLPDPSQVVRTARGFKDALLAREAAQVQQMTNAWLVVEGSLEGAIGGVIAEIEALTTAGETVTRARILRLERYQSLITQVRNELVRYVDNFAAPLITSGQSEVAAFGLVDAAEATQISFISSGSIGPVFNRLPVGATEFMAGVAGDGSPLIDLLRRRVVNDPEAIIRITDTLVEATALGFNPAKTARLIKDDLAGGLNNALQIARSEQLRVYRESSRLQYQESGVVEAYKRLSAKDERVCPACLMADGMIVRLESEFAEHTQGRCSLVPVVIGVDTPEWETGREWFETQPEDVQRQILGPGRFDAWQAGEFELSDLITRRSDPVWGDSLVPTPLKDLIDAPAVSAPRATTPTPAGFSDLTQSEIEKLSNEFIDPIFDDLTQDQRQTVADYTGGDYVDINDDLRDDALEDETRDQVAAIDAAIEGTPGLLRDTNLYRGNELLEYNEAFINDDLVVGDVIIDEAFMSTTIDRELATRMFTSERTPATLFQIQAPQGTAGIFVEPITFSEGEQEWILPRGTRLRIISVDKSDPMRVFVVVEIVEN